MKRGGKLAQMHDARLLDQLTGLRHTAPTDRAETELILQMAQAAGALLHRAADGAIGDRFANADVHAVAQVLTSSLKRKCE